MMLRLETYKDQGTVRFGWQFAKQKVAGYLTVQLRSKHTVYFSERRGYKRWHYFGPVCWNLYKGA